MMEKLGVPQTHLALKAMIKEVDEDGDDKISFREVRTPTYYLLIINHKKNLCVTIYTSTNLILPPQVIHAQLKLTTVDQF